MPTQQSVLSARWSSVGLLLSTPESQRLKPETEHAAPTSMIQEKACFDRELQISTFHGAPSAKLLLSIPFLQQQLSGAKYVPCKIEEI